MPWSLIGAAAMAKARRTKPSCVTCTKVLSFSAEQQVVFVPFAFFLLEITFAWLPVPEGRYCGTKERIVL